MRKCFRTIDKPQIIVGLEIEDISLIVVGVGIGSLLFEPYIPGILGICSWFVLTKFKQGKPAGYMLHRIYLLGFSFPGLIPLPGREKKYGAYGSNTFEKFTLR